MKIPDRSHARPNRAGSTRRNRALLLILAMSAGALGVVGPTSSAAPSCFGRNATIMGDASDETLRGTSGTDVIIGRGGHDTIRGRGGKDFLCGNNGEDVMNGGRGHDRMNGQQDIDYLAGDPGDDKMIGGGAGDEVHGNIGRPSDHDVAKGAKGPDFIDVADGRGNDTAAGGAGADTCMADPGDSQTNC